MWEFAYPYANLALNLMVNLKTLREVGRPHKNKQRPLTPFERYVNGGVPCNIDAMWSSMHHLFSLGYGYREVKQGHENRGVPIISLGPVPRKGSINPHSHYALNLDTKKVEQFRTIRTFGTYPWRERAQHSLATLPGKAFGPSAAVEGGPPSGPAVLKGGGVIRRSS